MEREREKERNLDEKNEVEGNGQKQNIVSSFGKCDSSKQQQQIAIGNNEWMNKWARIRNKKQLGKENIAFCR